MDFAWWNITEEDIHNAPDLTEEEIAGILDEVEGNYVKQMMIGSEENRVFELIKKVRILKGDGKTPLGLKPARVILAKYQKAFHVPAGLIVIHPNKATYEQGTDDGFALIDNEAAAGQAVIEDEVARMGGEEF